MRIGSEKVGEIQIDYLDKGRTMNGERFRKEGSDLLLNNALVRTCVVKIVKLKCELLPHPPYSPDFDSCDIGRK